MRFKKRYLLLIPLFVILGILWFILRPETYLPHQKIIIVVPFDKNNPPDQMIPMGETLYHPKPKVPKGHPGIDFGWSKADGKVLSSSEGSVRQIKLGASEEGLYDVEIASGFYFLRYKELKKVNSDLKVGSKVKKGDFIGTPGTLANGFHWELASISLIRDRYCPVSYLDPESKTLIENIWDKVPSTDKVKNKFPEICSGDYKGVVE
ncbi:MAG TPA: hypothetical protein VLE47_01265 [Candidatus Saccharimonadales bacterium]|nr:hypothetical protein [Candidatus Saccharimonadales bacterium]